MAHFYANRCHRSISFLQNTIFDYGQSYAAKFLENKSLFDTHANTMADDTFKGHHRKAIWNEIKTELGIYENLDSYE